MDKGLETALLAVRRQVQAAVIGSAVPKLSVIKDVSDADLKEWAKFCGLQPPFFLRCLRKANKVSGQKKLPPFSMLDMSLVDSIQKELEIQSAKRDWDVSAYVRSLFFFYLSDTKEPPNVDFARRRGAKKREDMVPASRLHIRVPPTMKTALSMRAKARKMDLKVLMRSIVAMNVTGKWDPPPRLMKYKDCLVPLESYFLPKSLAGEDVSVEPG